MNASRRGAGRTAWVAIRAMALFTVLLGVGYTMLITGIGQAFLPAQANGSLIRGADGQVVGSSLIGQSFVDQSGDPLPEYFQSRPSAAGYDGAASSGSNLGPENPELVAAIAERKAQIAEFNGVNETAVPADAVTASSSGLDPHISEEYAAIQVARVAKERGLDSDTVRELLEAHTTHRVLGYLGENTVNVQELNIALDKLKG